MALEMENSKYVEVLQNLFFNLDINIDSELIQFLSVNKVIDRDRFIDLLDDSFLAECEGFYKLKTGQTYLLAPAEKRNLKFIANSVKTKTRQDFQALTSPAPLAQTLELPSKNPLLPFLVKQENSHAILPPVRAASNLVNIKGGVWLSKFLSKNLGFQSVSNIKKDLVDASPVIDGELQVKLLSRIIKRTFSYFYFSL